MPTCLPACLRCCSLESEARVQQQQNIEYIFIFAHTQSIQHSKRRITSTPPPLQAARAGGDLGHKTACTTTYSIVVVVACSDGCGAARATNVKTTTSTTTSTIATIAQVRLAHKRTSQVRGAIAQLCTTHARTCACITYTQDSLCTRHTGSLHVVVVVDRRCDLFCRRAAARAVRNPIFHGQVQRTEQPPPPPPRRRHNTTAAKRRAQNAQHTRRVIYIMCYSRGTHTHTDDNSPPMIVIAVLGARI